MIAIECSGVSKRFRAPGQVRPSTVKERVLRGRGDAAWLWALREVDVHVPAGGAVGVIGANGAGKSTLLRLVTGVGRPDAGHIGVRGRLAGLLDLQAGFHPELTGRENGELVLVASGVSRRDARRRVDPAAVFAGVERFLDAPVRTYSSGMRARLGLALMLQVDADVFVVDEALSVGDAAFRHRCVEAMASLRRDGATVLMVSHDLQLVDEMCDQAMWLREGRVVQTGTPGVVVSRYVNALAEQARSDLPERDDCNGGRLRLGETRFGSQQARLACVEIRDATGAVVRDVPAGAGLSLRMAIESDTDEPLHVTVTVRRDDGVLCIDASAPFDAPVPSHVEVTIPRLDLGPGRYWIDVGLYSLGWERTFDLHWHAHEVVIHGSPGTPHRPVLVPPITWADGS